VEIDVAHVDAALTPTRAVRRRLALSRDVDNSRWLIVRDPGLKADLPRLYNERTGRWMSASAGRLAGTG
jgi:hypothetical protein